MRKQPRSPLNSTLKDKPRYMKPQDWSAVVVMGLVGSVCLYFAIDAVISDEVICLSRGCARYVSRALEPEMFYFNVSGLLIIASLAFGGSVRVILKRKNGAQT